MYSLKGFASLGLVIQNAPGLNSSVGELSTYAKTYTKELGQYSLPDFPNFDLFTMSSVVTDGGMVKVPDSYVRRIIEVCNWIGNESINGAFTDSSTDFANDVLVRWGGDVEDISAGAMLEVAQGIFFPEFISFKAVNVTGFPSIEEENRIKIWFVDDAFRRQYDEFEIVVVPPVDNVDDLIQGYAIVRDLIASQDDTERQYRLQEARGVYPDTVTSVRLFDWSNPDEPDKIVRTPWGLIIYGLAGNTLDNIKNALVNYILSNSAFPRDVWIQYLPDIFKTTEHIIVPLWDNYSIPNETIQQGLFSPMVDYKIAVDRMVAFAPTYVREHIQEHLSTIVFMYRSMGAITVGGPENRDEKFKLKERFTDYVVAPSTSFEFSRMSPRTQDWVVLISEMLRLAETMTEFSDMPARITRLVRSGVLYAAVTYEDVQYLVVSQKSYMDFINTPTP
jgi:hypothetical protein